MIKMEFWNLMSAVTWNPEIELFNWRNLLWVSVISIILKYILYYWLLYTYLLNIQLNTFVNTKLNKLITFYTTSFLLSNLRTVILNSYVNIRLAKSRFVNSAINERYVNMGNFVCHDVCMSIKKCRYNLTAIFFILRQLLKE